jgi:hypothetical protein
MKDLALQVSRLQPLLEDHWVHRDVSHDPFMAELVKGGTDVAFQDPLRGPLLSQGNEALFDGIRGGTVRAEPIRIGVCHRFRYGVEREQIEGLECSIEHGGHIPSTLPLYPNRLWDSSQLSTLITPYGGSDVKSSACVAVLSPTSFCTCQTAPAPLSP